MSVVKKEQPDSQKTLDQRYREKWKNRGYSRACVMYPDAYREDLAAFVEKQRRRWEKAEGYRYD